MSALSFQGGRKAEGGVFLLVQIQQKKCPFLFISIKIPRWGVGKGGAVFSFYYKSGRRWRGGVALFSINPTGEFFIIFTTNPARGELQVSFLFVQIRKGKGVRTNPTKGRGCPFFQYKFSRSCPILFQHKSGREGEGKVSILYYFRANAVVGKEGPVVLKLFQYKYDRRAS